MKFRKVFMLSLVFSILISMSGCAENRELYERLIIKAIGIDKAGDAYSVTVRVADYAEDKEYNLSTSGKSVFEAMSDLQLAEGRAPMYSHSHFILFGREVLDNDLRDCLDFFIRYYKAHPNVQIFAAEKTAAEILQYKNDDGFIPSDRMIKLSNAGDISGKAVSTSLMKLVSDSEEVSASAAIPLLNLTHNGAAITGSVLLKEYRFADMLSLKETTGLLAAEGELKKSVISAESEKYGLITAEVDSCKTKISASDDYRIWQIDIKSRMSLASSSNGARDFTEDDFRELEAVFAAVIKNYVSSVIASSYSSGCDVLMLGRKIYFSDSNYWKENSESWLSLMSTMQFNINVTTDIERLGEEDHSNK